MLQNQDIQFPLAYNFPQDDMTGVVDRSFGQEAFQGWSFIELNSHEDIGSVGMAGSSTVNNGGEFAVSGAGSDIWNREDSFQYTYGSTSGDVSIEMFVESFTGNSLHQYAKGGLMLRDSLSGNSKHFSLYVTGENTVNNQWRLNDGELTNQYGISIGTKTAWLKITKTGNVFQAYYKTSVDTFSSWNTLGSSQTIYFGSSDDIFYYGIAVTSHARNRLATLKGKGFRGSRLISNQKFSLVDPKTNMALSVISDGAHPAGVHVDGNWQDSNGEIGRFFMFDVKEWREYFGSFSPLVVVLVKQCRGGETVYTGEIWAWEEGSCGGDYCGKGIRYPSWNNSGGGDWQGHDYIVKPGEDCNVHTLKTAPHNKALTSQQFRITENDQLESIYCPGKVLSVAVQATSWMCKRGDEKIGLVTVDGSDKPEDSECDTKKGCINGCTIDPTPINDYCVDGNKLLLKASSPSDISQKWRFYHNGIMNLACKREPLFQGLVISQVNDDSLFEDVELSFVNDGMAISVGEVVSLKFPCMIKSVTLDL
eukprot:scaffold44116_cov37-Cyclotella_meneghiniana.AAC.1